MNSINEHHNRYPENPEDIQIKTESGYPISPADFKDEDTDEVDWISFYEECEQ